MSSSGRDAGLLLIRHGESEWNASGRWQGHADPPLSERGLAQAARLAGELGRPAVARLVVSDLQRARQTAAALERAWGLAAEPRPTLRWTGLTRAEIQRQDAATLARFDAGEPHVRPGGGETRAEIRRRVRAEVGRLVAGHDQAEGLLVIVAHAGVIRALWPGVEPRNARAYAARWSALRLLHERSG